MIQVGNLIYSLMVKVVIGSAGPGLSLGSGSLRTGFCSALLFTLSAGFTHKAATQVSDARLQVLLQLETSLMVFRPEFRTFFPQSIICNLVYVNRFCFVHTPYSDKTVELKLML